MYLSKAKQATGKEKLGSSPVQNHNSLPGFLFVELHNTTSHLKGTLSNNS